MSERIRFQRGETRDYQIIRNHRCAVPGKSTHAADVNSGNFMLPYCKQWVESERMSDRFSGICAGTIATLAWNASALEYPWRFCAPDGVTNGQLGRVVVSHFEKHPEELHLEFRKLALDALKQAWPCRETADAHLRSGEVFTARPSKRIRDRRCVIFGLLVDSAGEPANRVDLFAS
ncbi:MAG TPA: Rap1a/Tai family immunity protein [Xanthobacteraceae bacterium]|nr:Rap1a/Tai family immunity protein [Xanthobacteraceae bacterium]